MNVGDLVRVLEPFSGDFPEVYEIERIEDVGGLPVYYLVGIESGFSDMYLGAV